LLGCLSFAGGWKTFGGHCLPLGLTVACHLFDKSPEHNSRCLRPLLPPLKLQAPVPNLPNPLVSCEQREIIFETTFDINGDFKNFEATQWVVQEFKRRGLKKLFKPVTSTAYTKLVVQFYANLYTNCNRRSVLFSTVQRKQVKVTTAGIAATLKCNDEYPPADAQLDEQLEFFYISEIIEDVYGQYADEKNNAGTRSNLPPQLWLVDSILQRNVCQLGHKTQRRDQFI
jgi:hypothetical protein